MPVKELRAEKRGFSLGQGEQNISIKLMESEG